MARNVALAAGEIYQNRYGGQFYCMTGGEAPILQNIASGWTLVAHGVTVYEDGTIEWDYSTSGRFEEPVRPWP